MLCLTGVRARRSARAAPCALCVRPLHAHLRCTCTCCAVFGPPRGLRGAQCGTRGCNGAWGFGRPAARSRPLHVMCATVVSVQPPAVYMQISHFTCRCVLAGVTGKPCMPGPPRCDPMQTCPAAGYNISKAWVETDYIDPNCSTSRSWFTNGVWDFNAAEVAATGPQVESEQKQKVDMGMGLHRYAGVGAAQSLLKRTALPALCAFACVCTGASCSRRCPMLPAASAAAAAPQRRYASLACLPMYVRLCWHTHRPCRTPTSPAPRSSTGTWAR